MLGEIHDVFHEFPEHQERIAELRGNDREFAGLMAEHDRLDEKIRGLEGANQPVMDEYMEDLKKHRVVLKDRIYERIRQHLT